jgi:hypothetical protein
MTWLWGSGRLPQGGESSFPLPRGLGGRCGRRRRGRCRTPSRPSGARRRLRGARRLSRRLPGSRRSRARPRCCLLCRLRGSGRGGRRLPPHGESPPPIALILLVRRRVLRSRWGGEPQLLAQPKLLTPLFPALSSPDPLLLLAHHPLLLPPLCRVHAQARGVGGLDHAVFTAITCRGRVKLRVMTTPHESIDRRGAGIHSPKGRGGA